MLLEVRLRQIGNTSSGVAQRDTAAPRIGNREETYKVRENLRREWTMPEPWAARTGISPDGWETKGRHSYWIQSILLRMLARSTKAHIY